MATNDTKAHNKTIFADEKLNGISQRIDEMAAKTIAVFSQRSEEVCDLVNVRAEFEMQTKHSAKEAGLELLNTG
ncbi:MAG: hypothetical protein JJ858_08195 [Rhizobiaceae bacterium]|nr:hypothetical protein [Rhizobiaceae bacterium]